MTIFNLREIIVDSSVDDNQNNIRTYTTQHCLARRSAWCILAHTSSSSSSIPAQEPTTTRGNQLPLCCIVIINRAATKTRKLLCKTNLNSLISVVKCKM